MSDRALRERSVTWSQEERDPGNRKLPWMSVSVSPEPCDFSSCCPFFLFLQRGFPLLSCAPEHGPSPYEAFQNVHLFPGLLMLKAVTYLWVSMARFQKIQSGPGWVRLLRSGGAQSSTPLFIAWVTGHWEIRKESGGGEPKDDHYYE